MKKIKELVSYLQELNDKKFTGCLKIIFNQGGIRGIKKIHEENVNIDKK